MDGIGRRFYHLLGGLWLISMYYILGREGALIFYALLSLAVAAIEAIRLSSPKVNEFVFRHFGSFIRKKEAQKPTGTLWYIIGVGLTFYLFSPEVATAAVCFLVFGDVSAAIVGQRWGRTRIGEKSLEGTFGFLFACGAASFILSGMGIAPSWTALAVGTLIAALVELMPIPLNDNFAIPVISGGAMEALSRLAG